MKLNILLTVTVIDILSVSALPGRKCRPEPKNGSSHISHRKFTSSSGSSAKGQDYCIDFTFDNENWYFRKDNPWGDQIATFGSLENGRMCFPYHDVGGAIFISPTREGVIQGSGNTKLECHFPKHGRATCDISLVDGFSLPVTCTFGDQRVGGEIDLWSAGNTCEDESFKHLGMCINPKPEGGEKSAPAFFQPAVHGSHNYCIWTRCHQVPMFHHHSVPTSCHIGSTILAPTVVYV